MFVLFMIQMTQHQTNILLNIIDKYYPVEAMINKVYTFSFERATAKEIPPQIFVDVFR